MIERIVQAMRRAESLLFITWAGVSAESVVPTYRGIGGLYNVDTTEEGYSIEEALSSTSTISSSFHRNVPNVRA